MEMVKILTVQLESFQYKGPVDFIVLKIMILEMVQHLIRTLALYGNRFKTDLLVKTVHELNAAFNLLNEEKEYNYLSFEKNKTHILNCVYQFA